MKKDRNKILFDLPSLLNLQDHDSDLELLEAIDGASGLPFAHAFIVLIKSVRTLRREMNVLQSPEGVKTFLKDMSFDEKMDVADSLLTDLRNEKETK